MRWPPGLGGWIGKRRLVAPTLPVAVPGRRKQLACEPWPVFALPFRVLDPFIFENEGRLELGTTGRRPYRARLGPGRLTPISP